MKKTPKNFWLRDSQDTAKATDQAPTAKLRHDPLKSADEGYGEGYDALATHERPLQAFGMLHHKFKRGEDSDTHREDRAYRPEPERAHQDEDEREGHDARDDMSSVSLTRDDFDSISNGTFEVNVTHKTPAEVSVDGLRCMCPACLSPPQPADEAAVTLPGPAAPIAVRPNQIETTDAADTTATTYALALGETAQGTISSFGDRDWFAVTLQANQTYTFAMTGTGSNNVIDPYLRLYNSTGTTELAFNDDSLPGNNSIFTFTPTTSGTFYLAAGAFDDTGAGQYGVSATIGTKASFDTLMGAGVMDTDSAWTSTPGTGAVVTYAFRQTAATYTVSGSDITTFTQLSGTQIAAVRLALQAWSEVSGITFVEVNPGGYSNNATMLFANYSDANDGAGAFAFFPGSTAATAQPGDVWLNTNSIPTGSAINFGSYAYSAIAHEIGHAIGLSHPGTYNAAPGVSITYAANAQFQQDTNQYTIMSYFDEASSGAQFLGHPETPMLFDMYAAQQIYGVNTTTRSSDTIYGFNTNAGSLYDFSTNVNASFTIWDGGGIDTLDASGYATAQVINLAEGVFSTIGNSLNNIVIALGAVIENAIGGVSSDTISGNDAANTLTGGAGNDTLSGGAGADTLVLGNGTDVATGGTGVDNFRLQFVSGSGGHTAQLTDIVLGESISWTALQTSIVGGTTVTFVGPIVAGNGTTTALNSIDYSTSGGNTFLHFGLDNTAGADFTLNITGTFGIGQFTIEQNNASGAILRLSTQATTYTLSPGSINVNEGAGTATFTVTRAGETPAETIFASTTTGEGSANSGDFTALADQAIAFAAGELTKTVTVTITNDTAFETNETFGLVVQRNSTDADTTFLAKSLFTIQDNDTPSTTYSMTPATTSVSEGVGTVTFTITRSGSTPAETIFASTTTGEGFANSGDFTALADQAIAFAAGELTKTVTVAITNDSVFEAANETFGLVVQRNTTDTDATFLTKSTFTILDNDSAPDTTAPTLTTSAPADNTTNIALNANIVLTFNEAVQAGNGILRLVNLANGSISFIQASDTSQVTFAGNTMTINPTANLSANTPYELRMPNAGTVKDLAGNNFPALSNPINFTTGTSLASPQASALPSTTIEGTSGNDILAGTAGDNTLLGKGGTDKFVWTTTNGSGDGIGNDTIDARAGERLDFDWSLLQTLKLSSGSLLTNGALITAGNLLGGAQPSLARTDADTLAFDWNGDGVADLNVNFTVAPRSLTYDAQNGDILVG